METQDVAETIRLAVAPVFLIAGIGALLSVLTSRLARVVDRARTLDEEIREEPKGEPRDKHIRQLADLDKRLYNINCAVAFATLAALLVCLLIIGLFLNGLLAQDISVVIASLFIATMLSLIACLCFFIAEVGIAARTLRFDHRTHLGDRD